MEKEWSKERCMYMLEIRRVSDGFVHRTLHTETVARPSIMNVEFY